MRAQKKRKTNEASGYICSKRELDLSTLFFKTIESDTDCLDASAAYAGETHLIPLPITSSSSRPQRMVVQFDTDFADDTNERNR